MIRSRKILIVALLFPIVALLALAIYKKYKLSTGDEIILPVTGYDPRDLLSGHYMTYTVEYGAGGICAGAQPDQVGYVCLESRTFSLLPFNDCRRYIRGNCRGGRFFAGIERYYIPEGADKDLNDKIRGQQASLLLSVGSDGTALIKDLLINGRPWQESR